MSLMFSFKIRTEIFRKALCVTVSDYLHMGPFAVRSDIFKSLPASLIRCNQIFKLLFVLLTGQIGYSVSLCQHVDTPPLKAIEACHSICTGYFLMLVMKC